MRPLQPALAVLALLSLGSPACSVPEESIAGPRVGAAKAVAGRYYALLKDAVAAVAAVAVKEAPSPPKATGIVVDRRGQPVAGAQVVVNSWGGERLGEGRTGAGGR